MPDMEANPVREAIEYFNRLLHDRTPPDIPGAFADDATVLGCRDVVMNLRRILKDFAAGDLKVPIDFRGPMAGSLKAIQANLLHLTWQIQQVAAGDFGQRVDFMGEFSSAFNSMVVQLDSALTELRRSKEELGTLAHALEQEAKAREATLEVLKQSESKFKYLAEHDSLTGVFNRRCFFRLTEIQFQHSRLVGEPCCVAILDVDRFKAFNDDYGHLEGDKVLQHVCKVSQDNLREGDIMGRYGGEEFIFLFASASANQGRIAAERIRSAIADAPIAIHRGDVSVTVSLGLTEILPDIADLPDRRLIRRSVKAADMALYMAKRNGRNQTRFVTLHSASIRIGDTSLFNVE